MYFRVQKQNNQTYLACGFELSIQDLLAAYENHYKHKYYLEPKATNWSQNTVKLIREKLSDQKIKLKNRIPLICNLCLRGGYLSPSISRSFSKNFFDTKISEFWIDFVLNCFFKQEVKRSKYFIDNKDVHFFQILIPVRNKLILEK